MKKLLPLFCFILAALSLSAQRVYVEGTEFKVGGCPIYFNGANTPWDNWNDFGGNYDPNFWETHFAEMAAKGLNSSRVWISCSGEVQPSITSDGMVTGVSAQFWQNVDHLVATAEANGIYLMPTMMSFDHTKNTYTTYQRWRAMLSDNVKIQSYIDNYLVPFVKRYNSNPYVYAIDICNEIEWIVEDQQFGSYAMLQNFVARCAAAIHRNSDMLVSMGSAGVKWHSDLYDGNKWKNSALQAQFNDPEAFLDFYQLHYYDWQHEWYASPFEKSPADYNINDRPVVVGEMPGKNMTIPNMTMSQAFEACYTLGYKGHYPWTSNNAGSGDFGSLATFGDAALSFKNNHSDLVNPACVFCTTPNLGADKSLCGLEQIELSAGSMSLNNKTFRWYKNGTQVTESSATFTVTTPGIYKVEVDSASGTCVKEDEVVITDQIPQPSLGNDTSICMSTSILLDAKITGSQYSYSWSRNSLSIDGAESQTYEAASEGTYSVTVSAGNCTEKTDMIVVTSALLLADHDTICSPGQATVSVSGGTGSYTWHSSPSSGEVLSQSATYTPQIAQTTTFYVADAGAVSETIGISEPSGEVWNVNDFDFSDKQNKIIVTQNATLKAVSVYPSAAGTDVVVRVMQGTTLIGQGSVSNAGTGKTRVELNVNLAPGTYTIDAVGTSGTLRYKSDGAVFPYSVDGYLSFMENATWATTRYGMFYDWEVSTGTLCVRTPVQAVLDPLNTECTVTGIALSENSSSKIFPNPFSNEISVSGTEILNVTVKSINGMVLYSTDSDFEFIDLAELPKGIYLVEVTTLKGREVKKVVKK